MHNDLFSIGSLTIHGYGLMIGIGFAFAILFSYYRAKRRGLSTEAVVDLGLIAVVFGFLGAKLFFIIVEARNFFEDPLSVIGSEGFVVYGGIIFVIIASAVYCKRKKLNFMSYFDVAMPAVAGAQGFGRIGCFLAGCCYGRETDSVLGIVFPEGSMSPVGVKLLPTQLFSAGGNFLIMAALILYGRKTRYKGNVGAMYLILNGIGRFAIEFFRGDEYRGRVGVLYTSQIIAIPLVIIGIVIMIFNCKRNEAPDIVGVAKCKPKESEAKDE